MNNEKHQKEVQLESTEEFCKRLDISVLPTPPAISRRN